MASGRRINHKLNVHLHKKFLPRIGVDSHLPLVYRYSPHRYQGLNSLHVEVKQFVENLKIFLFHMSTKTQFAQILKANIQSLQLCIGSNSHIFHLSYEKYGFLVPPSWITHLWEMSFSYQIQINGNYEKTHSSRIGDKALMEMIIESDIFSKQEIININDCHLYLQVQCLSDITNGYGTHINYCAQQNIKDPDRISKYQWPLQKSPPKKAWIAWDRALSQVWSKNESFILHDPLGRYISDPPHSTPWRYHLSTNTLYYKISSLSYNIYQKIDYHTCLRTKKYVLTSSTFLLPPNTISAIVNK